MRIVSDSMFIISGAYLAIGVMYLRFWRDERSRRDYLAFTVSSFAFMLFSWLQMRVILAQTPEEYLFFTWWSFFPGTVGLISVAWFGYLHLHGRKWVFWTYSGLRILALILHSVMPNGINFREITSLGSRTVLGETLSYPIAVPNPWTLLPQLSHILLIGFFLDASVRFWRSGQRRQALIFGTGTILFGTIVLLSAPSAFGGQLPVPAVVPFAFLFFVAPMLYELNYDMHRAAMLSEKLEQRDARLTETLDHLQLSAAAANVGMWTRKIGDDKIWVSEKAGEIFGFPTGEQFTREEFFRHVHPSDRVLIETLAQEWEEGKNDFQIEFRMVSKDGNVRWMHTRGKVEPVNGSRIIRGAIVDITRLKVAEEAVRELSRRLMNAQEKERARLARELHDDLSQRISLLSIQLQILRDEPEVDGSVKDQLDDFVSDVNRLTGDVHRISHELHPALLSQVGLEAALRRFCRELAAAHPLQIYLEAEDLSRDLPDNISLCLYRVTQESLQNVIKHSAATSARVSIRSEDLVIRLSIYDNGNGFDPEAAKPKEALGLISIDERVRGVEGTFKIISAVGEGTKIEVHIPVNREVKSFQQTN